MRSWWTAKALLEAQVPGWPTSKPALRKLAATRQWDIRGVEGKGHRGGSYFEYRLTGLSPLEVQALAHAEAKSALPGAAVDSDAGATPALDGATGAISMPEQDGGSSGKFDRAPARAKKRAELRLRAVSFAIELIESGVHTAGADVKASEKFGVSARAVGRWRAMVKNISDRSLWLDALVDGCAGNPRGPGYDDRIFRWFKADYIRPDRPPAGACFRRVGSIARAQGIDDARIPKCITLLRRLRREVPWQSIKFGREGAAALHRTYLAQRRDRSVFHALQCVNADGLKWNVSVVWPDGEVSRPVMWSFQDIYSGMILSWRVDKTENAGLVRLTTGDLIRHFGVPEICILDNTHAASSKWITGGTPSRHRFKIRTDDPVGLLIQLGARVINTIPRLGGSSKPIERAHGDFDRDIARHPALAGAWLGTNPMTRPDAAREPVPYAKFVEVVRAGIDEHNRRPGRRTAVAKGRSFEEVFRESYERSVIRKPTPEQLRLCLLAAERVLCRRRDGGFEICGNLYFSEVTAALAGQRVVVRFDPENLHQSVFIYASDGRYIGEAECRLPVGFADADAAREHGRLRRQNLRRFREIARAEKSMSDLRLAAQLPASPSPEPVHARVVRLVRPRIERPRPAVDLDEPDQGEIDWRKYLELARQPRESVGGDDLLWLRRYEDTPACRVRRRLFAGTGVAV